MRRILDWVLSIPFAAAFIGTLLIYDVVLRVASLFGLHAVERVALSMQRKLLATYRITGATLQADLSPDIRENESYIIVSNHQSMLDIPLFAWAFPTNNGKYITKKQLAEWIPGISANLKLGRHPLIDRDDRGSAVAVITELGERVARGEVSAVIFPEGTRARLGEMKPFKPAGLKTLLKLAPETKIVPCCLENSWRLMLHNAMPVPFGVQLRFWSGSPLERIPGETPDATIARVESIIRAHLDGWRDKAAHATATGN
ncbi:MAG: lysophospholipid acyltransferase family protein [Deltaproteobacteria bacterium]